MKNIERVWKAEQKYEAERKKIEELQKELKDERSREEMTRYAEETGAIKSVLRHIQFAFVWVETKKEHLRAVVFFFICADAHRKRDDRLDWMYQGAAGQVSRDEYLMGRTIDKQITDQYAEPESGPSAETGLLPGSIFNPATPASNLDLAAKIREDPLFEIRWVCPFPLWFLWKAAESHTINIVFFILFTGNARKKRREKSWLIQWRWRKSKKW